MKVYSFSPFGYEGSLVSVEVDLRRGIPAVDIVGLADGTVKESRERMRSAIRNSGFDFPPERVLISLSPADLKKEGAGFDLAVALAVLQKQKAGDTDFDAGAILVMGELELNGTVRPVRGIHAAVSTAVSSGIQLCIVPAANAKEAREVAGSKVFGAKNLPEAFLALENLDSFTSKQDWDSFPKNAEIPKYAVDVDGVLFAKVSADEDVSLVKGQAFLIRAMQVAAAGGHNLLAFGPPGCGKTLSLQRFSCLMPLLTLEEAQSVTRIYSIAGLLSAESPVVRRAPFRSPHQTASIEGICGGGAKCTPGEISLAHNGVLFLDEAAEFKTSVLQMLRVPLESGKITLSRAGRTTTFPADFQLLLATNPCPCGFYGSQDKLCLCSARSVDMYWKKFSGPLLDRIDIRVNVSGAASRGCAGEQNKKFSKELTLDSLRKGIALAVNIQRKRQGKKNSHLAPEEAASFCPLDSQVKDFLDKAAARYEFSPRAVSACLKLSRTIADLGGRKAIALSDMEEAVVLRKCEGGILL